MRQHRCSIAESEVRYGDWHVGTLWAEGGGFPSRSSISDVCGPCEGLTDLEVGCYALVRLGCIKKPAQQAR